MIFDEHDLVKTLNKADNFTAIGMAVGASAATAMTTGMAVTSLAATVVGTGLTAMQQAKQGQTANAFAQRNAMMQGEKLEVRQGTKGKRRQKKTRWSSSGITG